MRVTLGASLACPNRSFASLRMTVTSLAIRLYCNTMTATTSTPSKAPPSLFDRTPQAARELLTQWVAERGLPAYRAGQIARRLCQAPVAASTDATELPLGLRPELELAFPIPRLAAEVEPLASDRT